ncbi:hypothetical protein A2415_03815 [candidate division WWE3 bacterium RIFOXYC1_FULL_39_7]|uniref:Hemerythrin-like domain-containing protein n=2 Tax=Katanobacteria TaxID=422282 RepID=A0A1F4X9H6_UNCKA|nr:MAG: hypothetical protein A2415_03815 [candidate division WWE3 bacterium RIFOXYC1_FULL_39_7]OGC78181.1 MAG: hypothetical protein A2619_01835 [candidate division WWE3 bacterium RIFOXYD1_FULL_39_9]
MHKQFVWDDKYSVKVPSIDEQHKRFFELTNQILNVLDNPNFSYTQDFNNPGVTELKKELIRLVVELGNYAFYHLSYEETCMRNFDCSGCDGHTGIHDKYREKVKEYLMRVREEGADVYTLAEEIAEFSQNWLSGHILKKDREYIDCLVSNEVK